MSYVVLTMVLNRSLNSANSWTTEPILSATGRLDKMSLGNSFIDALRRDFVTEDSVCNFLFRNLRLPLTPF